MAKLLYITPTSLDGFIADDGNYDWSVPDDDVLGLFNDLLRPIGMYLYGRKTYETMAVWETPDVIPGLTAAMLEFGPIWRAADKNVYSKSPEGVSSPEKGLQRGFDPETGRELE